MRLGIRKRRRIGGVAVEEGKPRLTAKQDIIALVG
jgi:hypothetical protein